MKGYLAALFVGTPLFLSGVARAQESKIIHEADITYINKYGEQEQIAYHYFTEGDRGILRVCTPDGSSSYDIVGRPRRSDEPVRIDARPEGIIFDMPDQLCVRYSDEPGENMLECIDK